MLDRLSNESGQWWFCSYTFLWPVVTNEWNPNWIHWMWKKINILEHDLFSFIRWRLILFLQAKNLIYTVNNVMASQILLYYCNSCIVHSLIVTKTERPIRNATRNTLRYDRKYTLPLQCTFQLCYFSHSFSIRIFTCTIVHILEIFIINKLAFYDNLVGYEFIKIFNIWPFMNLNIIFTEIMTEQLINNWIVLSFNGLMIRVEIYFYRSLQSKFYKFPVLILFYQYCYIILFFHAYTMVITFNRRKLSE